MSTDEKSTGEMSAKTKKRLKQFALERPSDDKPFTVKILPFKARMHRTKLAQTFKKGQGVTMNGWQFQIRTMQPNGTIYLKPVGQIIEEPKEAEDGK
jgi:hypothetical protein